MVLLMQDFPDEKSEAQSGKKLEMMTGDTFGLPRLSKKEFKKAVDFAKAVNHPMTDTETRKREKSMRNTKRKGLCW